MMDFISWSDGVSSLIEIADKCKVPIWNLYPIILKLMEHDLLVLLPQKCQESRMETSQEA